MQHGVRNFALYVDGENAGPKYFPGIIREVQKYGSIAVKRVYADWTNPGRAAWKDLLHRYGARPIQQFNYGKDAADHALIMDAIEIMTMSPSIDSVCIVSSDNGFQFLASRLREMGKYVMGVGRREPPAKDLIAACHNYVYYDNLPVSEAKSLVTEMSDEQQNIQSPDEILSAAYSICAQTAEPVYLGDLGQAVKNEDPAFDPRSFGFVSLKKLVKGCPELFEVVNETNDRCFVQRLNNSDAGEKNAERELEGRLKRWVTHFGFIEGDDGHDYYFCKTNVISEQREHRFKIGQRFQFTVGQEPDPDAEANSERNGKASRVTAILV